MRLDLTPDGLLTAYANGAFPMADDEGRIQWLSPDPRGIIELDRLRVSRSLRSLVRRKVFDVTVDRCFDEVIRTCGNRNEGTWISDAIVEAYTRLHKLGFAHSVETWHEGILAGGLYGVAIGGAFFGESMFHRVSNASKVALVKLVERMRDRGFVLLDVQFTTEHLFRLGMEEIPAAEYLERLRRAIRLPCTFVEGNEQHPPFRIQWESNPT